MSRTVIVCVLVVMLQASLAIAESGRGRLPDGRAFRTDNQGMELVDYIAELEVTIEEQKRRIHGLLYEVEEKEDVIDALKRNGGVAPTIVETDILARETAREFLAVPLEKRETACPPDQSSTASVQRECPPCKDTGAACAVRAKTAENQVQALARQNQKLQADLATQQSLVSHYQRQTSAASASESNVESLQAALIAEKAQSKQLLSSLGAMRGELEALREQEESYKTQLANLTSRSAQDTEQVSSLNSELHSQNEELKAQVAKLESRLVKVNEEVEQLEEAADTQQAEPVQSDTTRASLSPYVLERINSERGELQTMYNRTRGMAAERDKRYALYRQVSDGSVRVRLSDLRSDRGVLLKEISGRIDRARSTEELSNLRRDLLDIKQIIKSDTQLLGRMANR